MGKSTHFGVSQGPFKLTWIYRGPTCLARTLPLEGPPRHQSLLLLPHSHTLGLLLCSFPQARSGPLPLTQPPPGLQLRELDLPGPLPGDNTV